MAKINVAKPADPVPATAPTTAEVPISTATATSIADNLVGHENATAAEIAAAVVGADAVPARRGRGGKRGPRADHGPTFPWSQPIEETEGGEPPLTLQNALVVVAANIVNGSTRGGLTLGALQTAFTAAIKEGHIALGDETLPLEVSDEDLALLTDKEVKKAYNAYAKAMAKNEGVEMPELATARRAKINTSRLASLFKPVAAAGADTNTSATV